MSDYKSTFMKEYKEICKIQGVSKEFKIKSQMIIRDRMKTAVRLAVVLIILIINYY